MSGRSWQARKSERDKWVKVMSTLSAGKAPAAPLRRAVVMCERHSSVAPDYDGIVSSFKHVIDGLIYCGIIEDDSMRHIGMPEFTWHKAPKNQGFIRVVVLAV